MVKAKVCIFIPIGDNCEALSWIPSVFDINSYELQLFLVYYGNDFKFRERFNDSRIKVIYDQSTSKFEKFYKYVNSGDIKMDEYKLFWIVDDDIKISVEAIKKFFYNFNSFNLDIAQPGCLGFAMGKQLVRRNQKYRIRFTNYVDGMAPLFSKNALLKCLKTFENCQSGRGIDHVWAALLGNPVNKIAVIDNSLMYHLKPSGLSYSRFENTIEEQYDRVKNLYLNQVIQFYDWDQKIVHNSIPSNQNEFISLFNPLVNKCSEIRQIGISKLSSYIFSKIKSNYLGGG